MEEEKGKEPPPTCETEMKRKQKARETNVIVLENCTYYRLKHAEAHKHRHTKRHPHTYSKRN